MSPMDGDLKAAVEEDRKKMYKKLGKFSLSTRNTNSKQQNQGVTTAVKDAESKE